jgi:predicted TIM-barrel enzyme
MENVMRADEMRMFGMPRDAILENVKESLTYKLSGPGMVIASYLSDAQEMIAFNDSERARQYINIAKMLMMEFELGFNPR